MAEGFETPEDAALDGYPRKYCCVIASRQHDDRAYVLLNTGTDNRRYLYGVSCYRAEGRWFEDGSSNMGGGWEVIEHGREVGILSFWGDAPRGADRVRLEFEGDTREEAVTDGAFLAVWWRVPSAFSWPRLTGARIDGQWVVPAPGSRIP